MRTHVLNIAGWLSVGFLLLVPISAESCDFCNCVTGINPFYNGLDRIGLTLLHQNSEIPAGEEAEGATKSVALPFSKILHGGTHAVDEDGTTIGETEQRTTMELSWRPHLSQSVTVTGLLPFVRTDVTSTTTTTTQGIGDATLLGHYVIDDLFSERTPSTLLIGGGLTIPTGRSSLENDEGERLDARLQPGSGSFGVVGNMLLMVPLEEWTVAADLYGKTNFTNTYGDRLGSSLAVTGTISHDLIRDNPSNFGLVGVAGVRGEIAGQDQIGGVMDETSGSGTVWANLGGQIVYKNFKLEGSVLLPTFQHRENGGAEEEMRITLGLRYEIP